MFTGVVRILGRDQAPCRRLRSLVQGLERSPPASAAAGVAMPASAQGEYGTKRRRLGRKTSRPDWMACTPPASHVEPPPVDGHVDIEAGIEAGGDSEAMLEDLIASAPTRQLAVPGAPPPNDIRGDLAAIEDGIHNP